MDFESLAKRARDRYLNPIILRNKTKYFCIGANKTGTTSIKAAFEQLGYVIGNQRKGEQLIHAYRDGNLQPIRQLCKTAEVFQDIPFSLPGTYQYLDKTFPGSRFILTVRDSPEQWYQSIIKFHSKLFGNGAVPTADQLKNAPYIWKGWIWESHQLLFGTAESDPYNKEALIGSYKAYNENVLAYFKNRPQDFLTINLSKKDSYKHFTEFLKIKSPYSDFPWENKTEDIKMRNK
jgi:hypothetical protein